jgi:DNA replication ATP-dependent helicase Dna2
MGITDLFNLCESKLDRIDLCPDQVAIYHRKKKLFKEVVSELLNLAPIQTSSFYSGLSYVSSSYRFDPKERFLLHYFRRSDFSFKNPEKSDAQLFSVPNLVFNILYEKVFNQNPRYDLDANAVFKYLIPGASEKVDFKPLLSITIMDYDGENQKIEAVLNEEPFSKTEVVLSEVYSGEEYHKLFAALKKLNSLPLDANLIHVSQDDLSHIQCKAIVLSPDLLFDVTAISECFEPFSTHVLGYILRKFKSYESSLPLIKGNIVNMILDQLVHNPSKTFTEVKSSIFNLYPMALSLLEDSDVKKLIDDLEMHFSNIQGVVANELVELGIGKDSIYLEPSFFSNQYGIQGRLDLFSREKDSSMIIELKSGRVFKPNSYGISNNHYHQTLCYDLIIQSVFGSRKSRRNFILYSGEGENSLRFAPTPKERHYNIILQRNWLFLVDRYLKSGRGLADLCKRVYQMHKDHIKGYLRKDYLYFMTVMQKLSAVESMYMNELVKFSHCESELAKLGSRRNSSRGGLSSLWMDDLEDKIERFDILNHLEVLSNQSDGEDPLITLQTTGNTARLSNFRIGDVAVMYPYNGTDSAILKNQIFKCTIIDFSKDKVSVRLRSRQENFSVFRENSLWNIEHDVLDNSFTNMTRSLFAFCEADPRYRALILGLDKPGLSHRSDIDFDDKGLTHEQVEVVRGAIEAKEYFLIWGPPGTGKTSVVLRSLVNFYMKNTDLRILVAAYTNRALDEICEFLAKESPQVEYSRVGSRYGSDPKFRENLLDQQLSRFSNRRQLRDFMDSQSLFIGTVSSLLGKPDLFRLLDFDVLIVDEASQIIEPNLIGLLSKVKKFILIGDHMQLPAVVLQQREESEVQSPQLRDVGFNNFADSLFERIFYQAEVNQWNHAFGKLTFQGRMQREIMEMANGLFYDQSLRPMPGIDRIVASHPYGRDMSIFGEGSPGRFSFIPTDPDHESDSLKVNRQEAYKTARVVGQITHLFKRMGVDFSRKTVGVITPYRAQIACILDELRKIDEGLTEYVDVDTVERFQGGARDIIVLSTCINHPLQLNTLVSSSTNGIDRKLNVAITRAREHFILIGNEKILSGENAYKTLISQSQRLEETFMESQ